MNNKLTPKQEKFCQEYVKTGNATKAYRLAYNAANMKEATINVKVSNMLKQDKIRIRIKELQSELEEKHNIDKDKILAELGNISFFDIRNLFDAEGKVLSPDKLTESAGRAIASVKIVELENENGYRKQTEYKLNDKNSAIDKLSKILGYFEKNNNQKKQTINIVLDETDKNI